MKKDYSIIIPHFNSEKSLNKLLETIPDIERLEILVVDDKTPNFNEGNIILKKNLKILKNLGNNKGAGACRNIGLQNAKGKWIIFADSDDYFLTGFLDKLDIYLKVKTQVVFFKTQSRVIGTEKKANRNKKTNNLIERYSNKENELEELLYRYEVPWGRMIKRNFLIENNIKFEEVLASNDVYFSILIAYHVTKVEVSREYIYCITDSISSLTKNYSKEIIKIRFLETIKICKFLKERNKKNFYPCLLVHLIRLKKFGLKEIRWSFNILKENRLSILSGFNIRRIKIKISEILIGDGE